MSKLNWDDIRIFLAVARAGRNADAARRLSLSHVTVTRHVDALETAIGVKLVHRTPKGISLTENGRAVAEYAKRMEVEALSLGEEISGIGQSLTGAVRLATPEAFGSYIVVPNIERFVAANPRINLQLVAETRRISLLDREADIAIVAARPTDGRATVQKLTNYRIGLYASRDYIARAGPITCIEQLKEHTFIWYINDLISDPQIRFLDGIIEKANVVFQSTSIRAQHNAAAAGIGIGVLPTFVATQDSRIVRILPEAVNLDKAYWLTVHSEYRSVPRIRAVVSFLRDMVSGQRDHFQ